MAVLKRFSYDNIVEHNPTAPDPVDYEGGGGGSGGVFFVHVTGEWSEEDQQMTYNSEKTFAEIMDAYNSGLFPVAIFNDNPGQPPTFIMPCNQIVPVEISFSDGARMGQSIGITGYNITYRHIAITNNNEVEFSVIQTHIAEST